MSANPSYHTRIQLLLRQGWSMQLVFQHGEYSVYVASPDQERGHAAKGADIQQALDALERYLKWPPVPGD